MPEGEALMFEHYRITRILFRLPVFEATGTFFDGSEAVEVNSLVNGCLLKHFPETEVRRECLNRAANDRKLVIEV